MATLKVIFDDGNDVQWFTGLTHVAASKQRWEIGDNGHPASEKDGEILAAELRLVESARTGGFGTCTTAMMLRMEGEGIGWRMGVIAPAGCAYLMGDDGKTIDRIS